MRREIQRVQLTPQTDLRDLIERVHADKTPRLLERDGEPLAVVAPVEAYAEERAGAAQTPAETIRAFYTQAVARPDVRELLSRLARE